MTTIRSTLKLLTKRVYYQMLEHYDGDEKPTIPEDFVFPLPPTNGYIVKAFTAVTSFAEEYCPKTGLNRAELYLETSKYLFDLKLPTGRWYANPANIEDKVQYLTAKRQKKRGEWTINANVPNVGVFLTDKSVPNHPYHWKKPNPALAAKMRQAIATMLSHRTKLKTIDIYTTTRLVEELDKSEQKLGELPPNSVQVNGSFALFYQVPARRNIPRHWRLDFLVVAMDWDGINTAGFETVKDASLAYYAVCVERKISMTNVETRKIKGQAMVILGWRWSNQPNHHHETIGGRCIDGEVLVEEQSFSAVLLAQCVDTLLAPSMRGGIGVMYQKIGTMRHTLLPTVWPFTVMSITVDYYNKVHVDTGDLWGSFIVWVEKGPGKIQAGTGCFCVPQHGFHVSPQDGTTAWIRSPKVAHYTCKIKTEGGERKRIGIAFAAKKQVLTGVAQQTLTKMEIAGKENEDQEPVTFGRLLTVRQDIPKLFFEIPETAKLLEKDKRENAKAWGLVPKEGTDEIEI